MSEIVIVLLAAALAASVVALAFAVRANRRLADRLRHGSLTDELTGLGNRRSLFETLDRELSDPAGPPRVLAILDLDGFKHYNDTYGHPAGDALLRRLGAKLRETVGGHGDAYRLGGDEFCILAKANEQTGKGIVVAARDALTEEGEGFAVTASCGAIMVPELATNASDAMRLADGAMYAQKSGRKGRLEHETREVLLKILREREPLLSAHGRGVARLAKETGHALAFDAEQLDVLIRTAELHEIGKIAIPEEILRKRGPLDETEWELIRTHSAIGERILGASKAMGPIATAVRSIHERWDGTGYPDGLAGDEIPLASRIVLICDAYDAMTSERAYGAAMSKAEALAELRRCAGGQFDPDLVELFCALQSGGVRPVGAQLTGPA